MPEKTEGATRTRKANQKERNPKWVNPVLAWSLLGGELIIAIVIALLSWR